MSCLGVHFAITGDELEPLLTQKNDDARIDYVINVIEDRWDETYLETTDKAWDAIHRVLSAFPPDTPWFYPVRPDLGAFALPEEHGEYPLNLCVLGGRKLMDDESQYFMRLIEPDQVPDIAAALAPVQRDWFEERYWKHCKGAWPEYGEEDLEYSWEYFKLLRGFFCRMAPTGRHVLFTASQ